MTKEEMQEKIEEFICDLENYPTVTSTAAAILDLIPDPALAEIGRLREVNAEMLVALKEIDSLAQLNPKAIGLKAAGNIARAAIAKAKIPPQ